MVQTNFKRDEFVDRVENPIGVHENLIREFTEGKPSKLGQTHTDDSSIAQASSLDRTALREARTAQNIELRSYSYLRFDFGF